MAQDADRVEVVPIEFDIPQMLSLLAQSLYPHHGAAVRELLANAVDALVTRRAWEAAGMMPRSQWLPQIVVSFNVYEGVLEVTDTGCGLTREEAKEFLGKIGRSGTRIYREEIKDRALVSQLIGQFGIGLLASFKLGDTVTIVSRSAKSSLPSDGIQWVTRAGQPQAELSACVKREVGTSVRVRVTDEELRRKFAGELPQLLRDYGDLLPFPIFNDRGEKMNSHGEVPWVANPVPDRRELEEFLMRRGGPGGSNRPLWVIPIAPAGSVSMRGVVYIPDDHNFVNQEAAVDLYVKGILVARNYRGVLPEHLLFCHGVIDCEDLAMIMSRDAVIEDSRFRAMKREIATQVLNGLRDLVRSPSDFRRVQGTFDAVLKLAASKSDEVFEAIGGAIRYRAGVLGEPVSLDEYRQQAQARRNPAMKKALIYLVVVRSAQERYQLDQLLAEEGLQALEVQPLPSWMTGSGRRGEPNGPDYDLLEKYATYHGMDLIPADAVVDLFQEVDEPRFARLQEALAGVLAPAGGGDFSIRVSRFKPVDLPMLLRGGASQAGALQLIQALRQKAPELAAESPDVGRALELTLRKAEEALDRESREFQVIVNADNPLVQEVADALNDEAVRRDEQALLLIGSILADMYNTALEYSGLGIMPDHILDRYIPTRARICGTLLRSLQYLLTTGGSLEAVVWGGQGRQRERAD